MGVMLSATDSLNWLASIIDKSPSDLTASLGDQLKPPGRVRYLPYLSGERTPHNDSEIRGSFTGLATETTRDDLTRAVLEGVAFGLRDNFEALVATDAKMEELIAIGGGTASRYWLRLIATVLGIPLHLPGSGEFGAALGAARLGMVAATGIPPEQVMTAPDLSETIDPDTEMQAAFYVAYCAFRRAYSAVKSIQ
jgi:xylulokinase